jgi:arylsulfatase
MKRIILCLARLTTVAVMAAVTSICAVAADKKPNILVIFGDDIGQANISSYTKGMMGYRMPNIDRIAKEGMIFTDYYAEQVALRGAHRSLRASARCEQG